MFAAQPLQYLSLSGSGDGPTKSAASRPATKIVMIDPGATLDDVREAVTTLEDTRRIARRVLGGAHPLTKGIENALQYARAILRAREDA